MPSTVTFTMPDGFEGDPVDTVPWADLAREQLSYVSTAWSNMEEGDVLALEDRNAFTEEWPGRRVFVVLDTEDALVFTESGEPIHEPSNFVENGRQPLHGDHGFLAEFNRGDGDYYRIPPKESCLEAFGDGPANE